MISSYTPFVKREWPRTKTALSEKDVKSNGRPRPPGFDKFESFVMMTSLQNIIISGDQGLLMLMVQEISDEDDQATKHYSFYLNVLWPDYLYQKF